jgi:glucose/arabinose dehydrogenase/chitodextrinase
MNIIKQLYARRVKLLKLLPVLALVVFGLQFIDVAHAATLSHRQSRAKKITTGTANSLAFTSAPVAGNLIIVYVTWSNTSTAGVSDSRGNQYASVVPATAWGSGSAWRSQMFYAKNIVGGSDTVTATFGTSVASFGNIYIHEYAGMDRVNPLEATSSAIGTASAMNSGSASITNNNDLIFGAGASSANVTAAGSGFTSRLSVNGGRTEDKNVATAGSYNATATQSGNQWVMHMAAFKAANDTTAPSVPANLTATAASSNQVNLSWTASTDNVAVTGYEVERCQGASCTNYAKIATATSTSYSDTGLSPSTTYRYRVRAVDAALNYSGYSTVKNATTPAITDAQAPSVPTGLSGTGVSISQINLSWTASSDNVAVIGYKVFRNGALVGTTATTTFQDTGLIGANTTYSYAVSAYDAAGNNSAQSPSVNASTLPDTTAPSVPTGLNGLVMGPSAITLNWNDSTDNVGVAGYKVYRDGVFLTSTSVKPIQDTGLTQSTTYTYQVSAYDAAGNESAQSAPVPVTTSAPDTTPPTATMTAPANGTTVSGTSVTVSANATDNVAVTQVEFLLDGVTFATDTTAPYSVQWNSTTTSDGPHTLSARARDGAGNFGNTSGVVNVTVNNTAPPLPSGLVGAWSFNEGAGTTATDVTANGNTLSLHNDIAWVAGRYGTGLRFDGLDDNVTASNSPSLNISGNQLTLSMWINPMGGASDQVVLGKLWNATWTSPYYQYGVELQQGALTPVFEFGTSSGTQEATMGQALPVGIWSHLAITYNGNLVRFYLNGNLVSTATITSTLTARDNQLLIGSDARPGQYFNGTLDDLRIYGRELTQTDVQTDMSTPLGGGVTDPNAPVVNVTSPANNAQVGGMITVTAAATDDTGIAGVQFYVDGTAVGPEDTAAPYAANWDTRTATNGAHTITARARDLSGNNTVSAPVVVNVVNSDYFQNEILATGFDLPTSMKFLPDGRMLVAELTGRIAILSAPYTTSSGTLIDLDINISGYNGLQQGIFDFALDPNFATNHYYYVFYTHGTLIKDRLSRFTANTALDGTVPGSEVVLYQDPQVAPSEHHGGAIAFANDGKLYFTTGEHFEGAPAQDLTSPRGKLHRINPDGSVPTDNPFYDGAGPNWDSVWAYGLRNPFRMTYDSATNRLLIGDVGGNVGNSYEEVNVGARGANYGWPNVEGPCSAPCTSPLYAYNHNNRDASITGGFVYHGSGLPAGMDGSYFFGDYAQNWIKRLTFDAQGNVSSVNNFEPANGAPDGPTGDVVYITQGPDGAIYYLDLGYSDTSGTFGLSKVRRIRYLQANQAPIAMISGSPTSGSQPLTVNFSSAGSNDPEGQPIRYSWDFGDGSALATEANPAHVYTQPGIFTVRLTVSDGVNSTFSTPLQIMVGNAPVATLSAPLDGATFRAGDLIVYSGDATDADETLPLSAYTWTIDFLHDGHVHPVATVNGTKSGTFVIPTSGHDFDGNTRYRFALTVTDSNGLRDTKSATIWPEKVNLSFDTAPPGLTLYLDGIAHTAPFTYSSLIGFNHTIEARNQTSGNNSYAFSSWSDGGAQTHTITVPTTNQSFTANYTVTQVATGLVGAWNFNEGTGLTAADKSGNANNGTLSGAGVTWSTAGKYGGALSFNGSSGLVTIPNSSSLNLNASYTLSAWIKPTTLSGYQTILIKEVTGGCGYFLQTVVSNIGSGFYSGGCTEHISSSPAIPVGQWSHIAAVFDTVANTYTMYLNGVTIFTQTQTANLSPNTQALVFGQSSCAGCGYERWNGLLDDIRIYNRPLSASEIIADMNAGL